MWIAILAMPVAGIAQAVPGTWNQSWADEFNTGQSDLGGWNYDLGNGGPDLPGWGNNELENYTNSTDNVSVSDGSLHIKAVADGKGGYTSGRIKTDSLFSQAYGLFEFRAKLPTGQGLWPALWMMPKGSTYGGWPTSGEIDVMESVGQSSTQVQGTLHSGPAWWADNVQTQTFANSGLMPGGFNTHDWHTYDLQWVKGTNGNPGTISWFVDGVMYSSHSGGWSVPGGAGPDAPFDKPFYIIMNMAVGGNYAGTPDLTPGAYDMQVDYVRAYTAVPEPCSLGLIALGIGVTVKRRAKAKRTS